MKKTLLSLMLLLISLIVHAQWTTLDNNIYNSNTGSVIIGGTAPTIVNASAALFPLTTAKFNIVTGRGNDTYTDLVVLNHSGKSVDAVQRQIGFVLKLSSESTTIESDKMGG